MNYTFKINSIFKPKILIIKQQRYLVLKENQCFLLPSFITTILTANNLLIIKCNFETKKDFFLSFKTKLATFIKKSEFPYAKKLIFKGLGYKFNFSSDLKYLELKLGYSHLIRVAIPQQKLNIKLLKNAMVISSLNLPLLGNFLFKIKQLRLPNIYKGKGIWYKNETKKLKVIKKK